jgi:hypothetical protein
MILFLGPDGPTAYAPGDDLDARVDFTPYLDHRRVPDDVEDSPSDTETPDRVN